MTAIDRVQIMADALMDRVHTPEQLQQIRDLFTVHEGDNVVQILNKDETWDASTITEEEKAQVVLAVLYRAAYSVMGTAVRKQAAAQAANVEEQAAAALRAAMGVE